MVPGVAFKLVPLLGQQRFTDPAPVEGDVVAGTGVVGKAVAVDLTQDALFAGCTQSELAVDEDERLAGDDELGAFDPDDPPPADPALIHGVQRVGKLPGAAMDIKHVKAVVGPGAGRRLRQQPVARAAAHVGVQALGQRFVHLADLDAFEKVVPEPVGFDNPVVKGIGNGICPSDELEVREGAGELPEQSVQAAVHLFGDAVIKERSIVVPATVAESIGHETIANEAQRAGQGAGRSSFGDHAQSPLN